MRYLRSESVQRRLALSVIVVLLAAACGDSGDAAQSGEPIPPVVFSVASTVPAARLPVTAVPAATRPFGDSGTDDTSAPVTTTAVSDWYLAPDIWPELQPALADGVAWTGDLELVVVFVPSSGTPTACRAIGESLPPVCEGPLAIALPSGGLAEPLVNAGSDGLQISDGYLTVRGSFDPTTRVFTVSETIVD
jgi:hypothetical protein